MQQRTEVNMLRFLEKLNEELECIPIFETHRIRRTVQHCEDKKGEYVESEHF